MYYFGVMHKNDVLLCRKQGMKKSNASGKCNDQKIAMKIKEAFRTFCDRNSYHLDKLMQFFSLTVKKVLCVCVYIFKPGIFFEEQEKR